MYRERRSNLAGAVVWERRAVVGTGLVRVLPDGCMDLLWHDGQLVIAGPDTRAHLVRDRPGAVHVGLRFAPGVGPGVFGLPASELRDQRVPVDEIWPRPEAARLAELLANAEEAGRARVLEAAVAARLRVAEERPACGDAYEPVPPYARVVAGLRAGGTVAALAREVGLSERQLHRRCLTAFGYGPKTLARVLRLGRALDLARAGVAWAEVAARAGYADQAHFSREVRALAGVPLTELLPPPAQSRDGCEP
ncbi:helix-turn-helix transcriptional regulator [Streptomyces sp. HSW2009]|uniref:helix-turn-helix transcriptional regulator n=1 Tax=Streptomyces sp. HSW2009 TaxID=3142890 RepID=UPI0032EAD600